jgi:hypothetical protein
VAKSREQCEKSKEVLKTMSDCAMNLLRNIALEEEALDVQILSTGVTDRNVHQFLGLVEDRIDALIQMKKATARQDLRREDFTLKTAVDERNALFDGRGALRAPHALPTLDVTAPAHEADDDGHRVVPIDVAKFKETMVRKAARQAKKQANMTRGGSQVSLMSSNSVASMHDRTNSRLSLTDGGEGGGGHRRKKGKR